MRHSGLHAQLLSTGAQGCLTAPSHLHSEDPLGLYVGWQAVKQHVRQSLCCHFQCSPNRLHVVLLHYAIFRLPQSKRGEAISAVKALKSSSASNPSLKVSLKIAKSRRK